MGYAKVQFRYAQARSTRTGARGVHRKGRSLPRLSHMALSLPLLNIPDVYRGIARPRSTIRIADGLRAGRGYLEIEGTSCRHNAPRIGRVSGDGPKHRVLSRSHLLRFLELTTHVVTDEMLQPGGQDISVCAITRPDRACVVGRRTAARLPRLEDCQVICAQS